MKDHTALRKKTDDEVRKHIASQAEVRRLLACMANLSPDVIATLSPARDVIFWSKGAREATGWNTAEAKGRDFFELLGIAGNAGLEDAFTRVAEGGEWEGEFEMKTRAGASRFLHGRWKHMPVAPGTEGNVLLMNRDITEVRHTHEQRLDDIGQLACGIAHDLNNVLVPIMVGADTLESDGHGGDSPEAVEMIKESAGRAAQIVRRLLLFVRGEDGEGMSPEASRILEESMWAVKGWQTGAPTHISTEPVVRSAAKRLSRTDAHPTRGNGELLLVADDEPMIANLCRNVLESHGYRVKLAADGIEALALFGQHRSSIRAVLSDMAMPFMDGVGLTKAIRHLDPDMPIVIATGSVDGTRMRALDEFEHVSRLPKPYTQRLLCEAVQRCLLPA